MAVKHVFPLYAQNAGLEITPETKEHIGKSKKEGIIQLRFFLFQSPADGKITQIKFQCEPWEAYDLALRMNKVVSDGGKERLTHKFKPAGGQEITTSVTIEKWERGGKSGLGIAVGRGNSFISVPVAKENVSRFLYAAEFLRFLATQQQWIDKEAA